MLTFCFIRPPDALTVAVDIRYLQFYLLSFLQVVHSSKVRCYFDHLSTAFLFLTHNSILSSTYYS